METYPSLSEETARALEQLEPPLFDEPKGDWQREVDENPTSLSEFKALSLEARRRLTEQAGHFEAVTRTGPRRLGQLKRPEARQFATLMLRQMDALLEDWPDEISVELFKLRDGTIVGGTIDMSVGPRSAHGHFDFDGRPFHADLELT